MGGSVQRSDRELLLSAVGADVDRADPVAAALDRLIATFESCEGGEGHSYPVPVVRFYGSTGTGWAALAACMDHGL